MSHAPIRLSKIDMTYEPYPFGVIAPVFDEDLYAELLATFPPVELFKFHERFGAKYSLSEKSNRKQYEAFIASNRAWREVHGYIKSDDFVFSVLDALRDHNVDLGLDRNQQSRGRRLKKAIKSVVRGRSIRASNSRRCRRTAASSSRTRTPPESTSPSSSR